MSVEVDMILGDPSAAAFQLSLECAKNEYLTDKDQRATYYLGGICCLMPEVTDDLQEAVRSMNRSVRTISAARNGLIVPPKMVEPKKSIALYGYRNDTEEKLCQCSMMWNIRPTYGPPMVRTMRFGELAGEVSNWNRAAEAVRVAKMPQFYRILENPESCSILDSSNFLTLTHCCFSEVEVERGHM